MNLTILGLTVLLSFVVLLVVLMASKKGVVDSEQSSSFECGFNSATQSLLPFSLQFYLIANIFLIFDVELVLLFPMLTKLSVTSFWITPFIFIVLVLLLSLGLFHEWNQKMLDWAK